MRFFSAALLALALAACTPSSAQAPVVEDQWRSIEIEARPVELGAERVGRLVFRGGLELRSNDPGFGGLSGLEVMPDGRLVAISDDGAWFSARLQLDDAGKLIGLSEGRLALMRDENGEVFPSKEARDSEGIAQLPDGRFAVSFEQTQTIRIYDFNRDGPFGAAVAGPVLAEVDQQPTNVGLEAIASTEDGDLVVGAEMSGGRGARLWRAPLHADRPAPVLGRYPLDFGFALVGLDRLPDNDFVALERFYIPTIGVRSRIAVLEASLLGGATGAARKDELALLEGDLQVDNFEGITAVAQGDHGVRLYIVSDNNFSQRQRTLLYAFDLVE